LRLAVDGFGIVLTVDFAALDVLAFVSKPARQEFLYFAGGLARLVGRLLPRLAVGLELQTRNRW
jgi:hypothetical protein